ncbi:interleukin-17 receptor C isoform X2 [Pogoniulus pusillus]|uniref:interleukin-17 receptor C isoform X2 n=1 Tax=Pogoniulus pusillus TaxID=488313 RepID=UPI0030B944E9
MATPLRPAVRAGLGTVPRARWSRGWLCAPAVGPLSSPQGCSGSHGAALFSARARTKLRGGAGVPSPSAARCGSRSGRPHPGAVTDAALGPGCPGSEQEEGAGGGGGAWGAGSGALGSGRRGAGVPGGPGPAMQLLGQLLLGLGLVAGGRAAPHDTLACSQGLTCRLLDTDVLCGMVPPGPTHGLALSQLQLEPALRCSRSAGCSPCLEARLRLALPAGISAGEPYLPVPSSIPRAEDGGEAGQWSPVGRATSYQPNITGLLLLFGHSYTSSRCVVVEVQATPTPALPGQPLGWVTFQCFEAPLGSELHVIAYSNSHQRLSQRQRVPDCSWPIAQDAVPQCQVPRLQVSSGPKEVVVMVQGTTAGHRYTLRLYYNQSRGTSETGHAVTASNPMNYSVPASKVLPCLCLQVWPETQDPLRTTLCPFSHDAEAWERLWARSQLVLHTTGQALSCSLLSPCDLSAELVPCWQPVSSESCQALPGLQQPAVGQEPQEFGGLRPHPNLCIQAWSGGQVQLTQCLRDRALPGHPDDVLLLEHGGNTSASLCALEQGACTLLSSFASMGVGHPGLLEQELQRDVAEGQCRQIWHSENSTTVRLWACPLHKWVLCRHWPLPCRPAHSLGTGMDGSVAGGRQPSASVPVEEGGCERLAEVPEGWLQL